MHAMRLARLEEVFLLVFLSPFVFEICHFQGSLSKFFPSIDLWTTALFSFFIGRSYDHAIDDRYFCFQRNLI